MHALPAAQIVKEHCPGTFVGWVVRRRCADLLTGNPYLDQVYVLEDRPSLTDLTALSRALRRDCWIVVCRRSRR